MEFLTHLSAAAAGSLISAVWEGVVLAACVALCLRLVPGITAAARSVVWSVVMVLVVALPFAHLSGNAAVSAAGKQLHIDERISLAIVAVWLLLSLFRAGQLIRSALYLSGISNNSTPIAVTPELAAILDHATPVALCVSDEVDRPSVFGFTHPRILIPASLLDKLSTAELTQIVLHEMEHLRRGDDWTNLLQKLSLVLFPLNPVLVWIERRLCLERELACDDQVLRATNARKAYAACLASLAEHSLVRRGVSLALGAWERQSELVRRVHRILLRPDREMGRRQAIAFVSIMVAGMVTGADALAHSPQLVSFGPNAAATIASASSGADLAQPARMPGLSAQNVIFHPGVERAGGQSRRPAAPPAHRTLSPQGVRAQTISLHLKAKPSAISRPTVSAINAAQLQPAPDRTPMVVMVTWNQVAWQQIAPGVAQRSLVSYAAVPTGNGWLFVQL